MTDKHTYRCYKKIISPILLQSSLKPSLGQYECTHKISALYRQNCRSSLRNDEHKENRQLLHRLTVFEKEKNPKNWMPETATGSVITFGRVKAVKFLLMYAP